MLDSIFSYLSTQLVHQLSIKRFEINANSVYYKKFEKTTREGKTTHLVPHRG